MFLSLNNRKKQGFLRLLVSYILVLLIPVVIGTVIYNNALLIIENNVREYNMLLLNQARDIMDNRLAEVDTLAMQISKNTKLKELLYFNKPIEGPDVIKILNISKDMLSYNISNSFISTFYLFLKNSEVILTPYTSYLRPQIVSGKFFKYGDLSYEEWNNKIYDSFYYKYFLPVSPVSIDGNNYNMLTYIQSLPYENPYEVRGAFVAFIDKEQIRRLLSNMYVSDGGLVYIADKDGRIMILFSNNADNDLQILNEISIKMNSSNKSNISGKDMTIFHTNSSYNDWTYIAAIPSNVIMREVSSVKKTVLTVMLIILLLESIISYILASWNSKPMKELVKRIRHILEGNIYNSSNEYDFLEVNMLKLVENNRAYAEKIGEQVPLLKAIFIDRLLKGEFNNINEIEAFLAHIGITFKENDKYIVFIAYIDGYNGMITGDILKELSTKRVIVSDILMKYIVEKGFLYNMDDDKIAVILGFNKNEAANIRQYVEKTAISVGEVLCNKYGINLLFAAGESYCSLIDIYHSFEEARQALSCRTAEIDNRMIWYDSIPKDNDQFYYDVEVEARLMNQVRSGNENEVANTLENLFKENILQKKLSVYMEKQFFIELHGTLVKLTGHAAVSNCEKFTVIYDLIQKYIIQSFYSPEKTYNDLSCIFQDLCSIYNINKKSSNVKLKDEIVEYIEKTYVDANTCLCSLASRFKLTEVYLSQFFKEQTGENISDYIEKIRLMKASGFLSQTSISIDDIAKQVGYNSSDTFRKAYKRIMGISPVKYRNTSNTTTKTTDLSLQK